MKEALKRLSAYFIDLILIYIVSALLASMIVIGTNKEEFLNTYDDYTEFEEKYINFFNDYDEYFSDNKLDSEEYNSLMEKYGDIAIGLEEAYSDQKMTKKEYNEIYNNVYDIYNDLYIEKYYSLAKANVANSIIAIVLTIIYFVVIQYYTHGQTLGKKLLKLRVVTNDYQKVTINNLLLRSLVINDVIWATIRVYCLYSMDAYGYFNASLILTNIMYLVLFISLLCIIYRKDKRALQDLFAGTKVIEVDDRR